MELLRTRALELPLVELRQVVPLNMPRVVLPVQDSSKRPHPPVIRVQQRRLLPDRSPEPPRLVVRRASTCLLRVSRRNPRQLQPLNQPLRRRHQWRPSRRKKASADCSRRSAST
jgi:hypothetical protein